MKPSDQATRCPACQTVFRVVADQLRVSEGWVRCGRCTNVFNAAENMVDMDGGWARLTADNAADQADEPADAVRESAPQDSWPAAREPSHRARQNGHEGDRLATKIEAAMSRAQQRGEAPDLPPARSPVPHAARAAAAASPSSPSERTFKRSALAPPSRSQPAEDGSATGATWEPDPTDNGPPAAEPRPARTPEPAPPPASSWARALQPAVAPAAQTASPADPGLQPSLFDATTPEASWPAPEAVSGLDGLRAEPRPRAPVPATAKPGFMQKAERDQQWRRPHMRVMLYTALTGSALLLAAQVTLAYRDLAAARFPFTKPVLEGLCAGLGCTVQAARAIDSLAVESSGLIRVERTPQYRLQVTLRNRAQLELALPALDVTFTDSRGEVISRKVLLPQDLGSTIDPKAGSHGGVVAAGREVTLQGTLQASAAAAEGVAGYTVELFYP